MNNKAKIAIACGALLLAAGLGTVAFLHRPSERGVPTAVGQERIAVEAPTEATTLPIYDYVPSETGLTERAKMLLKQNKDVAGWIRIEHTDVDYPFVKDPGYISEEDSFYGGAAYEPNYYYLDHAFDRSYDREGTLFMDYRDTFGSIEEEQSENIIIYGHNMANNNMFGSIRRYRQDYGFFEQSPFIELSSNYRDYDYVICCCCITSGYWYSDFIYWNMEELDDESTFNEYMEKARGRQLFDTGVDVKYGDKLLTLSTCYANDDNSRFLVIARRLRDGEVAGELSTIERTEAYKQAHASAEASAENSSEEGAR